MGALGLVQSAIFDQGAFISSAVFIGNNKAVCIDVPAAWDDAGSPAVITFQGSSDGVNFFDLYDGQGNETTMIVAPSQVCQIPTPAQLPLWLQFRSGTGANPVPQSAGPTLTITIAKLPYV